LWWLEEDDELTTPRLAMACPLPVMMDERFAAVGVGGQQPDDSTMSQDADSRSSSSSWEEEDPSPPSE